jgi:hypothetical protein
MKKRRNVDDKLVPIKENILEKQEKVHDVKVDFFLDSQKMEGKVKALENHLKIVFEIYM